MEMIRYIIGLMEMKLKVSTPAMSIGHVVCVAVGCSGLQCVAVCCNVLQCSVLRCVAVCCSVLQCVAVCCSALQCAAERIYCTYEQQYTYLYIYICIRNDIHLHTWMINTK